MASSGIKWQSVLVRTYENVGKAGVVREVGAEKKTMPIGSGREKNAVGIGVPKWHQRARNGINVLDGWIKLHGCAQGVDQMGA